MSFFLQHKRENLQKEGIIITAGLRYCVYIMDCDEPVSSFSNKKLAIKVAKIYLRSRVLDCETSTFIFNKKEENY